MNKQDFKWGTLYLGDSLEVLDTIGKFDHIITDPPYFIKKDKWDCFKSNEEYYNILQLIFNKCISKMPPHGNFIFFHDRMTHINNIMNFMKETPLTLASFNVWDKGNFRAYTWKNRTEKSEMKTFFNVCEFFLHYTFYNKKHTSDRKNYRPIKDYLIGEKNSIKKDFEWTTKRFCEYISEVTQTSSMASRHYFENHQWTMPSKRLYERMQETGYFKKPHEELKKEYQQEKATLVNTFNTASQDIGNVFRQNVIQYKDIDHSTPKPIPLIQKLVRILAKDHQIICDPFLGSGTLPIAINNHNLTFGENIRYLGIEKDEEIWENACKRIQEYEENNLYCQ